MEFFFIHFLPLSIADLIVSAELVVMMQAGPGKAFASSVRVQLAKTLV